MSPSNACPHPAQLQKLIAGHLAAGEQAEIARHLDECASCQALLEHLTGGRESWHDIARQLGRPRGEINPALADAMARLQADPGRQETAAERRGKDDGSLDFLDPPAKPGQVGRLDDYEILELVGRGGMGVVLKAHDPALHRVVAIKVMAPQLASNPAARQRFKREVKAAAPLNNNHVVTIHAVSETKGLPYLVMQYIDGRSLQERVDQCGALELKEILRIGMQAATGLAAAHAQGLVHRDIKPGNILLENGVERVKITDFGLARSGDDARVTQTGVVTGTPQYMAPEQARGEAVDHRADLFSLGGVLYAMCTGYAPFRASSSMAVLKKVCEDTPRPIRELNPDIPVWLAAIVEKLLAKDPAERFGSAKEVAELLGQHLAHLQQPAGTPLPPRVDPPRVEAAPTIQSRGPSLVLPLLMIIAPFVLVPALFVAGRFLTQDSQPMWLLTLPGLIGVGCVLAGVVLLVVTLARRSAAPRQLPKRAAPTALPAPRGEPARTARPNRSRGWVAVLIAGAVLLALLFCLLPLGLLAAFFLFSLTEMRPVSGGFEQFAVPNGVSGETRRTEPETSRQRLLESLSWFPPGATFFGAIDFKDSGSLTIDSPLVQAVLDKLVPPDAHGMFGQDSFGGMRLDRVSFAFVEHPQKPGESRLYVRFTGQTNRTRMTRWLLERFPDAKARQGQGVGEDDVTVISNTVPALTLVGDTDVLLAGYFSDDGKKTRHPQLITEALELRLFAGGAPAWMKPNVTGGSYQKALHDLPEKCVAVLMGDLPAELRQALAGGSGPFKTAPRFMTLTAANRLRLEARLPLPADAAALAEELTRAKLQAITARLHFGETPPERANALKTAADRLVQLLPLKPEVQDASVILETNLSPELLNACLEVLKALPGLVKAPASEK